MTVAVMFIGNTGVRKSTLLSQLGGDFKSGVTFRQGFTKDIYEKPVEINGKAVVLMDVPGLYEPNEEEVSYNSKKLTEVLCRGYKYKLFFVLKASNRGPDDAELVMMSKINQHIRQIDGSKVSFRVIVNHIVDQDVYDIYQNNIAHDNFQSLFSSLETRDYSFDIKIDNVILLRFNEAAIRQKQFRCILSKEIDEHQAYRLYHFKDLGASIADLKLFQRAMRALSTVLNLWITSKREIATPDLLKAALFAFIAHPE
ncbi:hypothetical protein BGX26_009463 [Mortierella sp. AD094]|nr:hypothetical protein BGX26_009463 [Mortierella sp. AD094]